MKASPQYYAKLHVHEEATEESNHQGKQLDSYVNRKSPLALLYQSRTEKAFPNIRFSPLDGTHSKSSDSIQKLIKQ